jgi:HD-like signal output (HDOD) protein
MMINKNDDDYEIYEIFKDQFVDNIRVIENNIEKLQSTAEYTNAVNNLFRIFHGVKANSRYFHFETITNAADKVEKILSALRDESGPADVSTLNWLANVHMQCCVWADEMENAASEFSLADVSLLKEVKINASHEKPSLIMKKLSLIYLDANKNRSAQLVSALQTNFLSAQDVNAMTDFESKLIEEQPNICIINFNEECIKAAKLTQIYAPQAAIIVVLDKADRSTYLKLGVEGIYHILTNPIMGNALKRELLAVTNSHFTARRFLISNKKIQEFIQTLQPLSASISQIQQICNDDELSVKDLINVVKADSIISGMVLKAARNPMYGLEEINTVDHAVSIFGKMQVQAIALSTMVDEFSEVDLGAYNMDELTFSNVAALRLTLMIKWYAKVSISSLALLSTTAILGNIGQLLLAEEISKEKKKEDFLREINEHGIQYAEEKLLHTTTALVSSDILSHWQLERDIVDSIRFSDNPQHAAKEIQALCLANHVVYRLIALDGNIQTEIPASLAALLQEAGLSTEPLKKALNAVVKIANKRK